MNINNYLNILNEGKDFNDSSLPNPYDYQSLELDSNVTKSDLNHLGNQLEKMKKYLEPEMNMDPYIWLYFSSTYLLYGDNKNKTKISDSDQIPFTIIDNGKRVGIVSISKHATLKWVSWVSGKNYATRGTMKMLEKILIENKQLSKEIRKNKYHNEAVSTYIYHKNMPSIKVAKKLKMEIITTSLGSKSKTYLCLLSYPFWFLPKEKKKWFN